MPGGILACVLLQWERHDAIVVEYFGLNWKPETIALRSNLADQHTTKRSLRVNYRHILTERRGRVAIVTLNRPERLNALNMLLIGELYDAFERFNKDADVGVIILTGAGRAFAPVSTSRIGRSLRHPRMVSPSVTATSGVGWSSCAIQSPSWLRSTVWPLAAGSP